MKRLGRYEILDQVGRGGMGVVYRARDTELGRTVALKLLPPELAAVPERRARLRTEARATASLNHPNIATLYDLGEALDEEGHNQVFLTMEYVEGEDLSERVSGGPLPPHQALAVARQVTAALQAAHTRSILHRDLKPGNIRLTPEGRVKVLDFGLAKMLQISEETPTESGFPTQMGTVKGTVPYMAPEQARGLPVDERADLYSLGVLLYEMLTGRRPIDAHRLDEYLEELDGLPARAYRESLRRVEPEVAALIECMLEPNPKRRSVTVGEVGYALDRLLGVPSDPSLLPTQSSAGSKPSERFSRVSRRRLPIPTAGVYLLAAGALVAVLLLLWWRGASLRARAPDRLTLAVLPFENLTGKAEWSYIARGLSSALASELSSLAEVEVIAPSIAVGYLEYADGLERLVRRQGVDLVLQGRVQQAGTDGLQVSVDVLDPRRGSLQWSKTSRGEMDGLMRLQSAMGLAVATGLRASLSQQSQQRLARLPTTSNEAYRDHLRGLQFVAGSANERDLEVAVHYFEKALELDPNFAYAHAGLAQALLELNKVRKEASLVQRATKHAEEALRLDPSLVDAKLHLSRAYRLAGRLTEAQALLSEISDPELEGELTEESQTDLVLERAYALRQAGRQDEAQREFAKATSLAPDDWHSWHERGVDSMKRGDYVASREQLEEAQRLDPSQEVIVGNLLALSLLQGDWQGALKRVDSFDGPVSTPSIASNAGYAAFQLGDLEQAERYFRLATRLRPSDNRLHGNLADVLARMGRPAAARSEYEEALTLVEQRLAVLPRQATYWVRRQFLLAKLDRCQELEPPPPGSMAVTENQDLGQLAKAHAMCGDGARALDYLRRALAAGASRQVLRSDEELSGLHENPEFERLLGPQL